MLEERLASDDCSLWAWKDEDELDWSVEIRWCVGEPGS